ncbi:MAG: methyltransferase domain-containing protein, partial [Gammaproteobacteria bacterium]|nr:methyltransferase domain-containing protein [Gammaproteobacteria bacterium]
DSWLAHARAFAGATTDRFALDKKSLVVEIASNDGYLLQYFKEQGIPVLGVEPARNVAKVAIDAGIDTLTEFFGVALAQRLRDERQRCDLLVGNNVLAHVPDLNDFVAGLGILLADDGVLSMEFPHLLQLVEHTQFDTIYHEHFSYFSLLAVQRIFGHHDLEVFDVEELSSHGGSLRVYAQHAHGERPHSDSVERLLDKERGAGLDRLETYAQFSEQVFEVKRVLLEFLIEARRSGKPVVGYGAPAKGNTLLNFCGIGTDFIEYTVDRSPHKQGRFLPGTHIPIHAPERIAQTKPDYVLILPWNLQDEILEQMAHVRGWGGRFVVPIPRLTVLP